MNESTRQTLGPVISIAKGKKHEVTDSPSGKAKRLIGIDDLRNDDLIRYTDDASGTEAIPDDVLIAWDGANSGTIGFGKSGYIGSTIARLRVRAGIRLFTPFLGLYLKSKFDYLRQTATGATIPHINRSALESIPLPVIEYDGQIRIAHLLGKVEGLIVQRKQHLQQLDDLLKSVFLEMFGDPVRNEKGWKVHPLGSIGDVQGGLQVTAKRNDYELVAPYLRVANVYRDRLNLSEIKRIGLTAAELNRVRLQTGDLLIVEGHGNPEEVGRCAVWDGSIENCVHQNHLIRVRVDVSQMTPLYASFFINSPGGRQQMFRAGKTTSGLNTISSRNVKETLVAIPPLGLQNEFCSIVEKVEGIKSRYQKSLTDLEGLYGALSQQAFKGELDLSRVPLPSQADETPVQTEQANSEPTTPASFQLPEPEASDWLSVENRPKLFEFWLNAWCERYAEESFIASKFLDAASQRLVELSERDALQFDKPGKGLDEAKLYEEPAPFGMNEYEQIKEWVFDALASGKLMQGFDDVNNRIQLKAAQA